MVLNVVRLSNPLVTPRQLQDAIGNDGEHSISTRFAQAQLTQAAGVLLRLPQEVNATAIVLLQRYIASGDAIVDLNADSVLPSAAAVYLAAKISFTPLAPRSVINVYTYLTSQASPLWFVNPDGPVKDADCNSYYVSEGMYERERLRLYACEFRILTAIGFDTRVVLPHSLALTYMQVLGTQSPNMAKRVLEHLNGALLSPQFLYLTHQPNALAVAAIYLAAREIGVKLVEERWWEVFDVGREDLGFLVLAFGSLTDFVETEVLKWKGQAIPLK